MSLLSIFLTLAVGYMLGKYHLIGRLFPQNPLASALEATKREVEAELVASITQKLKSAKKAAK